MDLTQPFDLSLPGRRDAPALEWRGCTFTFGELDARGERRAGTVGLPLPGTAVRMASFTVPQEFRAVERLPRNAMGKVQKHLL